jgi:predicted Zn-dependent peptidase
MMGFKSWKEWSLVVNSLHKRMNSVTVGTDRSNNYTAMLVLNGLWGTYSGSTSFDSLVVDTGGIINCECNIFNTITMLCEMLVDFCALGSVVEW